MPKFLIHFIRSFLILSTVFLTGALGFALWDGLNTSWLPENLVTTISLKAILAFGELFPSLFLSAIAVAFSFSVRIADFFKDAEGQIDRNRNLNSFFYVALSGALFVLLFQFTIGPLLNRSVATFQENSRTVSFLESKLRDAHEAQLAQQKKAQERFRQNLEEVQRAEAELAQEIKAQETEAAAEGLMVSKDLLRSWNVRKKTIQDRSAEIQRTRPYMDLPEDWQDNILIRESEGEKSLSWEDQLAINQKILLYRPEDQRAREAVGMLVKAIEAKSSLMKLRTGQMASLENKTAAENPGGLILLARAAYLEKDFPTANELAYQAVRFYLAQRLAASNVPLTPEDALNEGEGLEILRATYEAFSRLNQPLEEIKRAEFFQSLQGALSQFNRGQFLSAYYRLQELSEIDPKDQEVKKYLELAEQEVRKDYFFTQEAEEVFQLRGSPPLVFLNPLPQPGVKELIWADTAVSTARGIYLKNFKVVRWNVGETPRTALLQAPYGVFSGGLVSLAFVDQHHSTEGSSSGLKSYSLSVNDQDMNYLLHRDDPVNYLSLGELYSLSERLPALGYETRLVKTVLVVRVLEALFVFALAFGVFWLSWIFRSRHLTQAPPGLMVLSIFIPLVVWVFYRLMIWLFSLTVGAVVPILGVVPSLILWGGLGLTTVVVTLTLTRQALKT